MPTLLQNYSEDLSGELLGKTLEICATLQNSKTTAVANTAAATLQQLVIAAFEKVSSEDGQFCFYSSDRFLCEWSSNHGWVHLGKPQGSVAVMTLNVDGRRIDVGPSAYDALRVGC